MTNSVEDFLNYLKENNKSLNTNFEVAICDFINDCSDVSDLGYISEKLGSIYKKKLYYLANRLNTLENEFHDIAKNNKLDGNNELRDLCLRLEDEMAMLKSAYKEP